MAANCVASVALVYLTLTSHLANARNCSPSVNKTWAVPNSTQHNCTTTKIQSLPQNIIVGVSIGSVVLAIILLVTAVYIRKRYKLRALASQNDLGSGLLAEEDEDLVVFTRGSKSQIELEHVERKPGARTIQQNASKDDSKASGTAERRNDVHSSNIHESHGEQGAQLQHRLEQTEFKKSQLEKTLHTLTERLKESDERRSTVQTDLAIERQWRQNLLQEIESERQKLSQLSSLEEELKRTKDAHMALLEEHNQLKDTYKKQEETLLDLGSVVSAEKLRRNELEQQTKREMRKKWEVDTDVDACKLCKRSFGLARRKHHCRKCGQIFCHDCSSQKAALVSNPTPVRVCDICFDATNISKPTLIGGWAD
eukprot:m.24539 g.24539  ORF g.24539 m.24539 type:complete len:368 (+) comp7616_c0_seq2:21-1124(+)